MPVLPSSKNRKRLEVPTYFYDELKKIADAEDRTVTSVICELIFSALHDDRPRWKPAEQLEMFTQRGRHLIDRALHEAPATFNHNYSGTEHILLVLAKDGDGMAGQILERFAITPLFIREKIESWIGRGDAPIKERIELTPRARKLLSLAVQEAERLGHPAVGTGHILLGLLREGQGIASGIVEARGVKQDEVRDATLAALAALGDASLFELERLGPASRSGPTSS